MTQPGHARLAPAWVRPQISEGKHVGVGPMSRFASARPLGNVSKLVTEPFGIIGIVVPDVPNIVGNSPHLRILPHFIQPLDRRRPRGKAEYDGSPGLVQGLPDHANIIALIWMAADAIHFN